MLCNNNNVKQNTHRCSNVSIAVTKQLVHFTQIIVNIYRTHKTESHILQKSV